ncbi:MAG: formate dehydrogenase accessory sulfurtransferase FdhD [Maritimibacter sp.]
MSQTYGALKRVLAEEVPVALSYSGTTLAVMMASPTDLRDFALGFALSEGVILAQDELEELEIVAHGAGYEARGWIAAGREAELRARQRAMVGPVGCGLCGIDTIEAAVRPLPVSTSSVTFGPAKIANALEDLRAFQPLHDATRAVHAAGFMVPDQGITHVREDVGRHNALDKLIGALAREDMPALGGALLMTSRISVDIVQKTALAGAGMIIAASAPTKLAVEQAQHANITLIANARNGSFDVVTHPERVQGELNNVAS